MTGRFISVVGPSGVGKDSVMDALAASDPRFVLARRVITRPSDAGGEDFEGVTESDFSQRREAGDFALSWQAHGMRYGIPASVDLPLADGRDILANLSRSVLPAAQDRFAQTVVILLVAPPKVLAARLAARGRESESEIMQRLERAGFAMPEGISAHVIYNTGPLAQTVAEVRQALIFESGARCT